MGTTSSTLDLLIHTLSQRHSSTTLPPQFKHISHPKLAIDTQKMVAKKTQRISKKEEDALIKMFSRDVSNKGQASFFVNALLAAATPLFMYIRIQQDVTSAWHVMAVFTAVTAYV